jgi:proton glutamate symport protein
MTQDLKADEKTAALLIPMSFATLRFGTIIYFIVSTIFAAALLGVNFDAFDLAKLGLLSIVASFVTLGSTGLATLIPLAGIMRSFGLSYELALPLLVVVDPIANMLRVMVNVAVNCALTASISKHVDGSNDAIVSPLSI